jgi:DNA invertase Pin-like site-specific DNA recombinase
MLAPAEQIVYGLAYYRISGSKEQKDSALSIPAQESHVLQAMEREGAVFLDADSDILTGKRSDRRGYQRILAVARRLRAEGKQVAIFVIRLDRFGRDLEERTRAWRELLALGVRLYSLKNGGWISDSFLYNIDSVLSQREIELTGDRRLGEGDHSPPPAFRVK